MSTPLASPRLVVDSRMSCTSWIPANPDACARLLPAPLRPAETRAVSMSQYVVEDSPEQATGLGAYSLTCLGLDVAAHSALDGGAPARFITHCLTSSGRVRAGARERGVPATPGCTTLQVKDGVMTATTYDGSTAIIRTRIAVGSSPALAAAGHLRYITRADDRLLTGLCPYAAHLAAPHEVLSIEFLEPGHPVYELRPAAPLDLVPASCFYAPRASFEMNQGTEMNHSLCLRVSV